MAAIDDNPDGVSLKLEPGDYVGLDLSGIDTTNGVSISSLDPLNPARLADVNLAGSANFVFEDIEFRADSNAEAFWGQYIVRVESSTDISFTNSSFEGGPGMMNEGLFGLYVNKSSGIEVTGSEFTNTERGALITESDNLIISGNYIHDLQSDGFDFVGVQDVAIDGNTFESFYPVEGDHADFIQFWLVGSAEGTENIQITNNLMTQSDGLPVQGIFITGSDTLPNNNFVIENNVISQSAYHGITVMGVDGLELNNNTVLSSVGEAKDTWIMLNGVTNGSVENNIATAYIDEDSTNITYANNIVADEAGVNGPTYAELFGNQITQTSNNLALFELQAEIGAGADIHAIMAATDDNSGGSISDDLIEGDDSGQVLEGFLGEDTLIGGAGDDVLIGGWGADQMTGGAGADVFTFRSYFDSEVGEKRDIIVDFDAEGSLDKIDLSEIVLGEFNFSEGFEFSAQVLSDSEKNALLYEKAEEFGSGVTNLGRDASLFGSDEMTISVTFELNDLNSGGQALLYNHTQYSLMVIDDSLKVDIRQSSGSMLSLSFDDVIAEAGWQDVQVVTDSQSGLLEVWLNGDVLFSETNQDIEIGDPLYWDVTAGGTPWGSALNGQIADVSVVDQALDMSQSSDIFERTVQVDQMDEYLDMDLSTGNTEAIFNDETDILSIDIDGDQVADMEIQLIGVDGVDLDNSDFLI